MLVKKGFWNFSVDHNLVITDVTYFYGSRCSSGRIFTSNLHSCSKSSSVMFVVFIQSNNPWVVISCFAEFCVNHKPIITDVTYFYGSSGSRSTRRIFPSNLHRCSSSRCLSYLPIVECNVVVRPTKAQQNREKDHPMKKAECHGEKKDL